MTERAFVNGFVAATIFAAALAVPGAANAADPVIAAAGDIACDPLDANFNGGQGQFGFCQMKATADLIESWIASPGLAGVLLLGDNQYETGQLAKYQASYAPSWGRPAIRALTHPVPGNHEYDSGFAADYYTFFGAAAGDPAKGYYSYDIGAWHLVALNSNCPSVGGCGAGSPQETWLAADLAAHRNHCTLAYWHHPRFTSGQHQTDSFITRTDAFWRDLYRESADIVLNGHDHVYERFAPQTPDAVDDAALGVRQFTVGTGGKNSTPFALILPNSAFRSTGSFGVLRLTLHPSSYDWQFVGTGGAVLDSGSASCHRAVCSGLCLNDSRFQVEATWTLANGTSGDGHGVGLTADTGYFWFFDASNVESVVKVIDGCALNGKFWVFAGGLTNVGVELRVLDTSNGELRTYQNPQGKAFQPIQDTQAFSCN